MTDLFEQGRNLGKLEMKPLIRDLLHMLDVHGPEWDRDLADVFKRAQEALDVGDGSLAPSLVQALRLHKAWSDSEKTGPDYGGQTRDTHPDGEKIWRLWWDSQLDLCDRATRATDEALELIEKGFERGA